ncbi:MAG: hypothetical protein ACTHQQ_03025 [Solirubrobacteraceae bacterium]
MQGGPQPSDAVIMVLGQALINTGLRTKLSGNAFKTGKDLGLSDVESNELQDAINKMNKSAAGSFDALAQVCRSHLCHHGFCPP